MKFPQPCAGPLNYFAKNDLASIGAFPFLIGVSRNWQRNDCQGNQAKSLILQPYPKAVLNPRGTPDVARLPCVRKPARSVWTAARSRLLFPNTI